MTTGRPNALEPNLRQSFLGRLADREACTGHSVSLHEGLGERFARLESRGRRSRADDQSSFGRKSIDDAEAERNLRTNDRQVDAFLTGKIDERRDAFASRRITSRHSRDPGNPRIPRHAEEIRDPGVGQKTPRQRVFARTASDHENSHTQKEL